MKLFVASILMMKDEEMGRRTLKPIVCYAFAESEEEALGRLMVQCSKEYPDWHMGGNNVMEIPKKAIMEQLK